MELLKEVGVLHVNENVDRFLQHVKAYVRNLGHIIHVDDTKPTFFLIVNDVVGRDNFCT